MIKFRWFVDQAKPFRPFVLDSSRTTSSVAEGRSMTWIGNVSGASISTLKNQAGDKKVSTDRVFDVPCSQKGSRSLNSVSSSTMDPTLIPGSAACTTIRSDRMPCSCEPAGETAISSLLSRNSRPLGSKTLAVIVGWFSCQGAYME